MWCGCADECSRSVREKDSVVEYYAWNFSRTVQDREEYGMHFSFYVRVVLHVRYVHVHLC